METVLRPNSPIANLRKKKKFARSHLAANSRTMGVAQAGISVIADLVQNGAATNGTAEPDELQAATWTMAGSRWPGQKITNVRTLRQASLYLVHGIP